MKIPAVFYGRAGEVSRRLQSLARELIRTRDYSGYDPGPMLVLQEVPGEILVRPADTRRPHFHCYMLSDILIELAPRDAITATVHSWLMSSLGEDWKFYCTLSGEAWYGMRGACRDDVLKYVDASVAHWPSMSAIQDRFGPQISGLSILHLWTTLFAAVEQLGVTLEERLPHLGAEPIVLRALVDQAARRG